MTLYTRSLVSACIALASAALLNLENNVAAINGMPTVHMTGEEEAAV
jgi:hypothetical protein